MRAMMQRTRSQYCVDVMSGKHPACETRMANQAAHLAIGGLTGYEVEMTAMHRYSCEAVSITEATRLSGSNVCSSSLLPWRFVPRLL